MRKVFIVILLAVVLLCVHSATKTNVQSKTKTPTKTQTKAPTKTAQTKAKAPFLI